jgi:hypothetical protein
VRSVCEPKKPLPGLLTESADHGNTQRVIGELRGVELMQGSELAEDETQSDRTPNLKVTRELEAGETGGRIVPHPDSSRVGLRHSLAVPGGGRRRREFR